MKIIEIVKLPDRKKKAICVYESCEENPTRYVVGYINHNEDLFKQALVDSCKVRYVKDNIQDWDKLGEVEND